MNWEKAEEYLETCELAYGEIGPVGMYALLLLIAPLRKRFNCGERTPELYAEIMEIKL